MDNAELKEQIFRKHYELVRTKHPEKAWINIDNLLKSRSPEVSITYKCMDEYAAQPITQEIAFQAIQDFIDANHQWTVETFPGGTATAALNHLAKEVKETIEAIATESPEAQREEFADMFLFLMNAATKHGISFFQLYYDAKAKMVINRGRTWGKPNDLGFTEHVKHTACRECLTAIATHNYRNGYMVCEECLNLLPF